MKITRCLFTFFLALVCLFYTGKVCAQITCTTTAPGVWDCGTPAEDDILIVNHDVSLGDWVSTGDITVNTGATLTFTAKFEPSGTAVITVDGTLDVSGETKVFDDATLIVNGTMNAAKITFEDNSSGTVSGTLNMTSDLELKVTSSLTVETGGLVSADKFIMNSGTTFTVEEDADATFSNTVDIKAGADVTVDGTFNTDADLKMDGTICGSGSVTYDSGDGCSGSGTACGDAGWCDGSGSINSGTLPIELVFFRGSIATNEVELSWQTATEINNEYFTILRSVNGSDYVETQTIPGAGNSDEALNYLAYDPNPVSGISYYRLKQTDYDGRFEYFNPIVINFSGMSEFKVYPNPVINYEVKLNLVTTESTTKVNIHSLSGSEVFSIQFSKDESGHQVPIQLPYSIAPGLYLLKVANAERAFVHKLLVR